MDHSILCGSKTRTTRKNLTLRNTVLFVWSVLGSNRGKLNHFALRKPVHVINREFLALKTENFQLKNFDIFFPIFAQNIDCGYTLEEAVLTSTHNLCFGAKIRKIGIPLHTPVLLYKSGAQKGIYFTDMFS